MSSCKFSMFNFLLFVLVFFMLFFGQTNALISNTENDRASLVSFMSGIVSDPGHALENWNAVGVHVCNWSGVECDANRERVIELHLSECSLRGTLSPALSNLSYLEILDLSGNFFEGNIPAELGSLSHLEKLSLSANLLEGNIPFTLGFLRELVYLDLDSNGLSGEIPLPLLCNSSLALQYVDLSNNSLSGKIPVENHCELRELKSLLLWSNQLTGEVPQALSNCSKLKWLDLGSNYLGGELPSRVLNGMPRLQFLYLSYNQFSSHNGNTDLRPFFVSLVNSSNLQGLELAGNHLGGELPSIIGDLSTKLVQVHLDDNHIYGPIPPEISNLFNLTLLNLSNNLLNGSIPPELCRLPKLERLYLSNNSLSGSIPPAFGDVPHLGLLDLSKNKLSGIIPDSFANLSQLRRLLLHFNQLSGTIPPSLGQCLNLEILDLSHNRISGTIPSEVARLSSLKLYLNFSSNLLHGPIPLELSKMEMVLAIDLSLNHLSGRIPSQLGSCIALESLNLSWNVLDGPLPESIGKLLYLRELDVSFNQLTGPVPESLQASSTLKDLNLSYNKFYGQLANKGAFSPLTIDSFLGNQGLCGSVKGMPSCRRRWAHHLTIAILLSLIFTPLFCIFGYALALKSKIKRRLVVVNGKDMDDEETGGKETKYPKISHQQLIEATGGFSKSSLIGSGRYGHVYKGILQDDTRIAVKVLNPKTAGEISRSFKRECRVLKRTRHRNLIRIITVCDKPDFKALIFPLMPNGSLENHLYPSHGLRHGLSLAQLVSICSDVAEGMAYLHHHSPIRVVHCDLKPSNILLDDDFTALVTDFGISRLIEISDGDNNPNYDSATFSSTNGLLCGSVGYIAPEYGMGKQASTQGDVYSYGVLLLEVATGKRPTEALFQEGASLHEWVKSHYPHKLKPIIEDAMLRFNCASNNVVVDNDSNIWHDVILEFIELGLMCTQYNPSTRPTMSDVADEVTRLKQYLSDQPKSLLIEEGPAKHSHS